MQIHSAMDLGELAARMGEATSVEAYRLKKILVADHLGKDTSDIEESVWLRLLNEVASLPGRPL